MAAARFASAAAAAEAPREAWAEKEETPRERRYSKEGNEYF